MKLGDRGEAVQDLQEALIELGYSLPRWGADGIFGKETAAALAAFVADHGSENPEELADAKRHAKRRRLLDLVDKAPVFECDPDGVEACEPEPHALALQWLQDAWKGDLREPPKGKPEPRIDDMIRGKLGVGWKTADAINWTPNQEYLRDIFAWCGATIARAHGQYGLKASIRNKDTASTGRLFRFCKKTPRNVALSDILPGDVGIVSNGAKPEGEHVITIERIRGDGLIDTIEGNARGIGPTGEIFEGLVRRTRPLPRTAGGPGRSREKCPVSGLGQSMELIHVYRFLPEDYRR